MSMNHITLMGTIVRGPEHRMTPSGVPMATISLAVTRPPRQEGGPEVTDYVRVVAWRNLADKVQEAVAKGDLVVVEGRLSTRSYETQDGQRRKTIEVEASAVEKVGAGKAGAAQAASGEFEDDFSDFDAPAPAAPARKSAASKPAAPAADLDDEIPF